MAKSKQGRKWKHHQEPIPIHITCIGLGARVLLPRSGCCGEAGSSGRGGGTAPPPEDGNDRGRGVTEPSGGGGGEGGAAGDANGAGSPMGDAGATIGEEAEVAREGRAVSITQVRSS